MSTKSTLHAGLVGCRLELFFLHDDIALDGGLVGCRLESTLVVWWDVH